MKLVATVPEGTQIMTYRNEVTAASPCMPVSVGTENGLRPIVYRSEPPEV